MSHKTFTQTIVAVLGLFLLTHLVVWGLFTRDLLNYSTGDLSRIGYLHDMAQVKKEEVDLPRRHLDYEGAKGDRPEIITSGDSFSIGAARGRNPFYQDYIATFNGLDVMHVLRYRDTDPLTTIIILLNSGWLDAHAPKAVLLETVERHCAHLYSRRLDFDATDTIENIDGYYKASRAQDPPKVNLINTGNFKFLLYSVLYRFSDHAFFSPVYVRELKKDLFSAGGGKLLFYHEDIKNARLNDDAAIKMLNDNLNRLAGKLRAKGIELYFMPAVDKYDLYSAYIKDNPYQASGFFEKLRGLPKSYYFIDTKKILSGELERGEKDIYYPDDTHWSWKASKRIFEEVRFKPFPAFGRN